MANQLQEQLARIYYNPKEPAGFGGIGRLKQKVKHDPVQWLSQEAVYTLHKPARKNYPRNRMNVPGIDAQWQADLVDMQAYTKYNNGYRYILTCIDIFSKYAWAVPLKKKTGAEVVKAFRGIFKSGRKPIKLNTDQGTEFENRVVARFLREQRIYFFSTRSDKKAAVVERFNRTLKTKMWRYFTHKNTFKYIDVLQGFLQAYNQSKHRTIGMAPAEVNYNNESHVYVKLNGHPQITKDIKYKFQVGDTVRISKQKAAFEKGYLPNWTEEIFSVESRYPRSPPVYKIKDYKGELIEGTFYEAELQRVSKKDDTYIVEKILKREKRHGRTYAFVKWRGYPSSMNSWVPIEEVIYMNSTT